jgi:hypothetical protein
MRTTMFSPELIQAIAEDRERSIADELRRRAVTRTRPVRWVRPPRLIGPRRR